MRAIILDTETTGKVEPDVIELAYAEIDAIPNTEGADDPTVHCQRYLPSKPIMFGAMATHNIRIEDLADCPPWTGKFELPAGVEYIIGHNVDFDWSAIGKPDAKRIDTLGLARVVFNDGDSYSQMACMYRINPSVAQTLSKDAHGAAADVGMNHFLLQHLCSKLMVETFDDLHQLSEMARVPELMPFGMHATKNIVDEVPASYKSWLLGQPDVDPYLIRALKGERGLTMAMVLERAKALAPKSDGTQIGLFS